MAPGDPDVHARLSAPPGARVADLGCGDGLVEHRDRPRVPAGARRRHRLGPRLDRRRPARNAAAEGLEDRVRFLVRDAGDPALDGAYDLVTIFEALHDMAPPGGGAGDRAPAARARRDGDRRRRAGGRSLHGARRRLERLMYGFSVVHCLAVGRADTATRRPPAPRCAPTRCAPTPATPASHDVEVLPIENDFWRFYRLDP